VLILGNQHICYKSEKLYSFKVNWATENKLEYVTERTEFLKFYNDAKLDVNEFNL
jgi:hypothetical protein